MRKVFLIVLFTTLCAVDVGAGNVSDDALLSRIFKTCAVKVRSVPPTRFATGVITEIEGKQDAVLFVSNKHVLRMSNKLELIIPAISDSAEIIDTFDIVIDLVDPKGEQLYVLADDTALDVAAIAVYKRDIQKTNKGKFRTVTVPAYIDDSSLFAGQAIEFSGYPLGLSVNRFEPLLRKGAIAGIDTLKNLIYLDADAFGGSSGSPVFLDFSFQHNLDYTKKFGVRVFIGIISAYEPFIKQYMNIQTGDIEMYQTENSGLAKVVPASQIKELAAKAAARLSK